MPAVQNQTDVIADFIFRIFRKPAYQCIGVHECDLGGACLQMCVGNGWLTLGIVSSDPNFFKQDILDNAALLLGDQGWEVTNRSDPLVWNLRQTS